MLLVRYNIVSKHALDHIDVLHEGFVFRLRIILPKEINLLRSLVTESGFVKSVESDEANELERQEALAQLTSALNGLSQRFVAFSATCRLAKRWFYSQVFQVAYTKFCRLLLTSHFENQFLHSYISDEAIELIAASLFTEPAPHRMPPRMPAPGLLRFFDRIIEHNWTAKPMIVDVSNDMKHEKRAELDRYYKANKSEESPMFIATAYDSVPGVFSRRSNFKNSPQMLLLLKQFAISARSRLLEVLSNGPSGRHLSLDGLFSHSLTANYHVIVKLKQEMVCDRQTARTLELSEREIYEKKPLRKHIKEQIERNRKKQAAFKDMTIVGFNPVAEYLDSLRTAYGHVALFFHDPCGGLVVGVKFNPSILEPVKLSEVKSVRGYKTHSDTELVADMNAIVADFKLLGHGLVEKVYLDVSKYVGKN